MRALEHFSNTASGAPLANKMFVPFREHKVLIIFRSRVKSICATRLNCPAQYAAQYDARSCSESFVNAVGMASKPGRPTFSERTRKATSVDSPIFAYSLLFKSNVNVESLHKEAHMDKCNTDGKSAGCFTTSLSMELKRCCLGEITPLDASRINPFGAYELPSTSNSLNKGA